MANGTPAGTPKTFLKKFEKPPLTTSQPCAIIATESEGRKTLKTLRQGASVQPAKAKPATVKPETHESP